MKKYGAGENQWESNTAWENPTKVLVDRNYDKPGQKSKPEWGISYSKTKYGLLADYTVEKFALQISGAEE